MSYRVYIKKDYKPDISWGKKRPRYIQPRLRLLGLVITLLAVGFYVADFGTPAQDTGQYQHRITLPVPPRPPSISVENNTTGQADTAMNVAAPTQTDESPSPWHTLTVNQGDNLSLIFDRMNLSPAVLYEVMTVSQDTKMLKRLMPGKTLKLKLINDELAALIYEPDLTTSLHITKSDSGYNSEIIITELEQKINEAEGMIEDSLFLAGQEAGLSDNLIMRFVAIYGWDIDFALDIRSGDRFKLIYKEQFKEGQKVGEGPILAAEFINRGKTFRAVRYTSPEGQTGYYNEKGYSMRKAFLRTPVKFNRISSRFNLKRRHPVLNRIRAHKGVDYAAPTGTPIKATGDGAITFVGSKGGYGKMIVIRHGGIYDTVYAHMSRYAKRMKRGKHVKQGDIIGYVGQTGLATGPHLHYEFRVHGVHRNPLTVKLPKALKIAKKHLTHFKEQTASILAKLDEASVTELALQTTPASADAVIALQDDDKSNSSLH